MKGEEERDAGGGEGGRTSQGWPRDHSTAFGTPNDAQCCFLIRQTSSYMKEGTLRALAFFLPFSWFGSIALVWFDVPVASLIYRATIEEQSILL